MNKGTVELLEKHFDIAFAAPDGIKELRELILTLAMRGKLVAQNPKDQPASELLQEIVAEKKRLVKEGKIKAPKPLPEIKAEEVPYELPGSWEWVRLAQFASIQTGKKDVNEGHENGSYPFFSCAALPLKSNEFSFDCEALLLPGNGANVGMVTHYNGKFEAYQRTYVVSDFFNISIRYIENTLKARFLKALEGKQYGSAINYIKLGNLTDFLVPLPPLTEQQRIVAKIDQLIARCDELEKLRAEHEQKRLAVHTAALNRLLAAQERDTFAEAWQFITRHFGQLYSVKENVAELRKTILQLAVMGKLVPQDPNDPPASSLLTEIEAEKQRLVKEGKIKMAKPLPEIKPGNVPYELPQNWEWMRLEDAVEISSGVTKGRKLNGKEMVALPYLRVANVQRGYLDLAVIKDIEIASDEIERFKIKKRDLLITEGGDWDKVGRTAIWNGEISQCIHQNHIFKARCLLAKQNEQWLEKYLNSSVARAYFADASKQTTNLASINKTQLRGCPVPLPPLPEQQRIVAKSDQLMALCDQLEQQIDAATEKQTALLNVVMAQV